jgi:ribosomal protein S3
MRNLFQLHFDHFQFKGFKLRLKGKISVAGNARTRTLVLSVGNTSHSKMSNRVAYDLSYVETFTGILGFKL